MLALLVTLGIPVLGGLQDMADVNKCLSGMAMQRFCLGARDGPLLSSCLLCFHPSPGFCTPFLSSPVGKRHPSSSTALPHPLPVTNWVLERAPAACTVMHSSRRDPNHSVMWLWGREGCVAPSLTITTIIVNITVGKILFLLYQSFTQTFTCLASPYDKHGWFLASF